MKFSRSKCDTCLTAPAAMATGRGKVYWCEDCFVEHCDEDLTVVTLHLNRKLAEYSTSTLRHMHRLRITPMAWKVRQLLTDAEVLAISYEYQRHWYPEFKDMEV